MYRRTFLTLPGVAALLGPRLDTAGIQDNSTTPIAWAVAHLFSIVGVGAGGCRIVEQASNSARTGANAITRTNLAGCLANDPGRWLLIYAEDDPAAAMLAHALAPRLCEKVLSRAIALTVTHGADVGRRAAPLPGIPDPFDSVLRFTPANSVHPQIDVERKVTRALRAITGVYSPEGIFGCDLADLHCAFHGACDAWIGRGEAAVEPGAGRTATERAFTEIGAGGGACRKAKGILAVIEGPERMGLRDFADVGRSVCEYRGKPNSMLILVQGLFHGQLTHTSVTVLAANAPGYRARASRKVACADCPFSSIRT